MALNKQQVSQTLNRKCHARQIICRYPWEAISHWKKILTVFESQYTQLPDKCKPAAYEFVWPSLDIPTAQLQMLPVKGSGYLLSWQQNHIICPSMADDWDQTGSCPITPLNSTCPSSLPLHPPLHPLIPHPILSGLDSGWAVCPPLPIHYPLPPPLSPAPWFTAGRKAWSQVIYGWFYVFLPSASNGGTRPSHGHAWMFSVSKHPGSFKAHHLHTRCSSGGHDLSAATSSPIRHHVEKQQDVRDR